jgi:hypothetical protein
LLQIPVKDYRTPKNILEDDLSAIIKKATEKIRKIGLEVKWAEFKY